MNELNTEERESWLAEREARFAALQDERLKAQQRSDSVQQWSNSDSLGARERREACVRREDSRGCLLTPTESPSLEYRSLGPIEPPTTVTPPSPPRTPPFEVTPTHIDPQREAREPFIYWFCPEQHDSNQRHDSNNDP